METDSDGMWMIGRFDASVRGNFDVSYWRYEKGAWVGKDLNSTTNVPYQANSTYSYWQSNSWDQGWWSVACMYTSTQINNKPIPALIYPDDFMDGARVVALSRDKKLFFAENASISFDDSVSVVHAITYPGGGRHFERLFGGKIVSVSDSGVYVGRILSGTEGGDPRGTWQKQTEIPSVY